MCYIQVHVFVFYDRSRLNSDLHTIPQNPQMLAYIYSCKEKYYEGQRLAKTN